MATKQEIRDRSANDLGILRIGQSLQAQDNTRILSAYAEVWAELNAESIAPWQITESVPDELVKHVVALVALNCLNTYGVSDKRYIRIMNAAGDDGVKAKRAIRLLVATPYVNTDEVEQY